MKLSLIEGLLVHGLGLQIICSESYPIEDRLDFTYCLPIIFMCP